MRRHCRTPPGWRQVARWLMENGPSDQAGIARAFGLSVSGARDMMAYLAAGAGDGQVVAVRTTVTSLQGIRRPVLAVLAIRCPDHRDDNDNDVEHGEEGA